MGIKELNFRAEIERLNPVARRIVALALLLLLIISLGCWFEDYSTSFYGLALVPGELANDWLRFLLAASPSLLQIVFAFVAVTQRNKLAGLITGLAWLFDFGTDMAFKMTSVEPTAGNILIVAVYSFFIMSFFSELMLMFTLQHLGYALGPALRELREAWREAMETAREKREEQNGGLMHDAQRMFFPTEDGGDFEYQSETVRREAQRGLRR